MEKVLNTGVKVLSLGVTTPATIAVVGELFGTYSPFIRGLIVLCGVGVVELVFLANWIAVDQRKADAPEFKIRPVVSTWVMYAALLALGVAHGEGLAAIPLRLALGLAIAGSTWDTIVYGWSKATARADRDIRTSGKVRREARRLATVVSIRELQADADIRLHALELRTKVETERIRRASEREFKDVVKAYTAERTSERTPDAAPNGAERTNGHGTDDRLAILRTLVDELPDKDALAAYRKRTGIGRTTAYADMKRLREGA